MSAINTQKSKGARFYVNDARPGVSVPGVTSVISMLPTGTVPERAGTSPERPAGTRRSVRSWAPAHTTSLSA
jgi:hypothetical protein